MSEEERVELERRAWVAMGSCDAGAGQMRKALCNGDHDKALLHARWTKEDAARVEEACTQLIAARKGKS